MTQEIQQVSPLPDINAIGECEDRSSILCERSAGRLRLNPLDMLKAETSFNTYVRICDPCYGRRADEYVDAVHRGEMER